MRGEAGRAVIGRARARVRPPHLAAVLAGCSLLGYWLLHMVRILKSARASQGEGRGEACARLVALGSDSSSGGNGDTHRDMTAHAISSDEKQTTRKDKPTQNHALALARGGTARAHLAPHGARTRGRRAAKYRLHMHVTSSKEVLTVCMYQAAQTSRAGCSALQEPLCLWGVDPIV
jgi:hypothetical protein